MEPQPTIEQTGKNFIEIEAQDFLEDEQNFFDQEPFSSVIQEVSENTNTEIAKLRRLLRDYAEAYVYNLHYEEYVLPSRGITTKVQHEPSNLIYIDYNRRIRHGINKDDAPVYKKATESVVKTLEDYPFWYEYVDTQRDLGAYSNDGTPKPKRHSRLDKTLTYAHWVTQRINIAKREKDRAVLLGIDEVFPQDFSGEKIDIPQSTGEKKGNRRWRILKASELIPERK